MAKKKAADIDMLSLFQVEPGSRVDLSQHDPGWIGGGMEKQTRS
jgi:hypothetical protein